MCGWFIRVAEVCRDRKVPKDVDFQGEFLQEILGYCEFGHSKHDQGSILKINNE